jgi:hypothetical protein
MVCNVQYDEYLSAQSLLNIDISKRKTCLLKRRDMKGASFEREDKEVYWDDDCKIVKLWVLIDGSVYTHLFKEMKWLGEYSTLFNV